MNKTIELWSYTFTPDYTEAERRLACVQHHTPLRKHLIFFVDLLIVRI